MIYKYNFSNPFINEGINVVNFGDNVEITDDFKVFNKTRNTELNLSTTEVGILKNLCIPLNKKIVFNDKVNHPSHYTWLKELCNIEVIDITRHLDFDLGNAIKYILRCGHKSELGYSDKEKTIEDLKKAIFYLNDKIKMLEQ